MTRLETFYGFIKLEDWIKHSVSGIIKNNKSKMQELVDFAEKHSFKVKKIEIPSREERNAR